MLAIEKLLLPQFPDFSVKGRLMVLQPLTDTLRGFHFEASAVSKKHFYVNVFFMPLYVPAKHVHFTFGHRVGHNNKRWVAGQHNLEITLGSEMQKEIPFLSSLKTAKGIVKALEPRTQANEAGYVNPHSYEALAYAYVRAGKQSAAERTIDALLKCANPAVAWENEVASRARLLRSKFVDGPENAREQLATWEAQTIHNLDLEPFRASRRPHPSPSRVRV